MLTLPLFGGSAASCRPFLFFGGGRRGNSGQGLLEEWARSDFRAQTVPIIYAPQCRVMRFRRARSAVRNQTLPKSRADLAPNPYRPCPTTGGGTESDGVANLEGCNRPSIMLLAATWAVCDAPDLDISSEGRRNSDASLVISSEVEKSERGSEQSRADPRSKPTKGYLLRKRGFRRFWRSSHRSEKHSGWGDHS